jgi:hypothetical protein
MFNHIENISGEANLENGHTVTKKRDKKILINVTILNKVLE